MTAIGVTGATGAMGTAVRDLIAERSGVELALASTRADPDAIDDAGSVVPPGELSGALDAVDVIVDFTVPSATLRTIEAAREADVPVVIGTTGFDESERATLERAAADTPVLLAANFSRGIQALLDTVGAAVADLPGYDIEITETHHARKRDAPSGTANRIEEAIREARPDAGEAVHGRVGEAPRSEDEIGVHARRAGSITGEHEVLLAGDHEELRLVHRAESRHVFAAGALDAATWIDGKPPGWYRFAEVLGA